MCGRQINLGANLIRQAEERRFIKQQARLIESSSDRLNPMNETNEGPLMTRAFAFNSLTVYEQFNLAI